ncbi:MAG: radical SAM protein, partial [Syntrophomonadaceae bacterium]|nr:radical SAM protein [Syntrophomonadaceae bacterium]
MATTDMKYIYGPVPSRRLGLSLGISPIPKKTCNYSCIYCQLGRTDRMTNTRQMFFPVSSIMAEFDDILKQHLKFDVVTIVGEGEPVLYAGLGDLILEIKTRTDKPVAVITNGSLLFDQRVQLEISKADIILPTLDAYDEASFRRINRPHRSLHFEEVLGGLKEFSKKYQGQLWIEIMLLKGINDDDTTLPKYADILKQIRYSKVYLNTPVRPPAEAYVLAIEPERMQSAARILGAIPIDVLHSQGFHSEIKDDYAAILSIIKRHPMNQHEIGGFLESRGCREIDAIL